MVQSMFDSFLFADDLLDLADLFLNFAGSAFFFAFSFQVWGITQVPGDLLDLALHLMPLAFRFFPYA
jgi:hypothetical protein